MGVGPAVTGNNQGAVGSEGGMPAAGQGAMVEDEIAQAIRLSQQTANQEEQMRQTGQVPQGHGGNFGTGGEMEDATLQAAIKRSME